MKYVASFGVMLALSIAAYGQQPGAGTPVVVQLQIVEISLTKLQSLGYDLTPLSPDPQARSSINQFRGNARSFSGINNGVEARQLVEALRKDHLAKVLAEPTLRTVSGKTTVFNSGARLPTPTPQQDGSLAIEYQYGTVVEVTPQVSGDAVHLTLHFRLAELDYGQMVRVGAQTVPGVQKRECSTVMDLKSGQTAVLGGLIEAHVEAETQGVPFISSIPYVGAMFRSVKERRNDVQMLVLVRPKILPSPATADHPPAAK